MRRSSKSFFYSLIICLPTATISVFVDDGWLLIITLMIGIYVGKFCMETGYYIRIENKIKDGKYLTKYIDWKNINEV